VIHFKTGARLADRNIKKALNHCLPESVAVRSLKSVTGSFHARYQSKSKHYRYKIYNGRQKRVFLSPAAIWFNRSLDVAKMKKAGKVFVGEHDFSSFAQDDLREHKVRRIKSLRISRVKDDIQIDIKGDGFLRHMVRIIVGVLIDVGVGKIQVESIQKILKAKKRQMAGPTAPAKGLSLIKVSYR
jgi:tRNA pseudouridine38-40 synthase